MKYFVYYDDDYAEMGGQGFESFETEEQALAFIVERMERWGDKANVKEYHLIEGTELELEAVEKVTKWKVKR